MILMRVLVLFNVRNYRVDRRFTCLLLSIKHLEFCSNTSSAEINSILRPTVLMNDNIKSIPVTPFATCLFLSLFQPKRKTFVQVFYFLVIKHLVHKLYFKLQICVKILQLFFFFQQKFTKDTDVTIDGKREYPPVSFPFDMSFQAMCFLSLAYCIDMFIAKTRNHLIGKPVGYLFIPFVKSFGDEIYKDLTAVNQIIKLEQI